MALAAKCRCGLAMILDATGFAHCSHCDRDCPKSRHRVKCGPCAQLDKS